MNSSCNTYICLQCNFTTNKLSKYNRHKATLKHIQTVNRRQEDNLLVYNTNKRFKCECGKYYKYKQGLWKHSKICPSINIMSSTRTNKYMEQLIEQNNKLIMQNDELKHTLLNHSKMSINNPTITINNKQTINKTFNLNFFLNETCKNAMNITDFVSLIEPNIYDLEETGKLGYVAGITNIILKNLSDIDKYKRPIHCSDLKREIIYVKENDIWGKNTKEHPVLINAIKSIAVENIKNINNWKLINPSYIDIQSIKNTQYLNIINNSMPGSTIEEIEKNLGKIASNVAKNSIIDKIY